jgi:hypothetical protein
MVAPGTREVVVATVGVAFVAIDFRTRAFDWLPDPIGWASVAWAAMGLRVRSAAAAAAVAGVLSVSDLALPYRVVSVDPLTGEVVDPAAGVRYPEHQRWDHVSDVRAVLMAAAVLAGTCALVLLVQALAGRAAARGAMGAKRRLDALGWCLPLAWALPFVAVVTAALADGREFDPVWGWPVELLALPGVAVLGAVVVTLATVAGDAWFVDDLRAGGPPGPEERRGRSTG